MPKFTGVLSKIIVSRSNFNLHGLAEDFDD